MAANSAEAVVRRDRTVVVAGLVGIVVIAWAYMLHLATGMQNMEAGMHAGRSPEMDMQMLLPNTAAWGVADVAFTWIMWTVMMVAMMTPSVAPMVVLFTQISRQRRVQHNRFLATGVFLVSYLLVWTIFSVGATVMQFGLHAAALLSPIMMRTSPIVGGVVLIMAGIYQFTPLKHACLSRCRTPLGFLLNEWREGVHGAFVMALRHGSYCVGCCWLLMALLFVAGVMNLLWVATIAAYILIEKTLPVGQWLSRVLGVVSIGWGAWLIIRALA